MTIVFLLLFLVSIFVFSKIDKSALAFLDVKSKFWVVEESKFKVLVRNSLKNILLKETFKVK